MKDTIAFLDFDGVLNHMATFRGVGGGRVRLDPAAIRRVQEFCDRADADVVVSSTWRFSNPLDRLRAMLGERGLTRPELLVDVTPNLDHQVGGVWVSPERGVEIAHWLVKHPDVTRFVIFDDDADMGVLRHFLIRTSFETGLVDRHVDAALALLQRQVGRAARVRELVEQAAASVTLPMPTEEGVA